MTRSRRADVFSQSRSSQGHRSLSTARASAVLGLCNRESRRGFHTSSYGRPPTHSQEAPPCFPLCGDSAGGSKGRGNHGCVRRPEQRTATEKPYFQKREGTSPDTPPAGDPPPPPPSSTSLGMLGELLQRALTEGSSPDREVWVCSRRSSGAITGKGRRRPSPESWPPQKEG